MRVRKQKPQTGKKPTGKEKLVDHSYIFLVPNDEDGTAFYKKCKKYIDKRYKVVRRGNHSDRVGLYKKLGKGRTQLMDVPIEHAENWRVYIELRKKRSAYYDGVTRLSFYLFTMLRRARDARLVNLMEELQREFKTKSTSEKTAVKSLMEKLLASYIAGKFKGKYD